MDFGTSAHLEGIDEDGITMDTDVAQHGSIQLTANGTLVVGSDTDGPELTLVGGDVSQQVADGEMVRYLLHNSEDTGTDIQQIQYIADQEGISVTQDKLSIQMPQVVKVNVPTVDSESGLTRQQSVYVSFSNDSQLNVKDEDESHHLQASQPQLVSQESAVTLVNVEGSQDTRDSISKAQSSLVQLTQDGKVNIVSRNPTPVPVVQPQILQQVMLPDGTLAYLNTTGQTDAITDTLQPVSLADGSISYIPTNILPEPAGIKIGDILQEDQEKDEEDPTDKSDALHSEAAVSSNAEEQAKKLTGILQEPPVTTINSSLHKSVDKPLNQGTSKLWSEYKCPFEGCGKMYTTVHHLKVHERSHTGDKPFRCAHNSCGKSFATAYGLKSHTRIHTGEKPYKCPMDQCTKAFKTSGDLQKHVRTHTGEKPFHCPFEGCDKSFTTSNIRKVHIRTHTGERPYVCPIEGCGKSFSSATNYKNHVRIHTGERPYVCTVQGCGKRFTEYSSLYKHHVVHTQAKPYACPHCGKTYRQTSTLAMHIRTAHNDESGAHEAELVLQSNQIFTVSSEDSEGALVINTAEANKLVTTTTTEPSSSITPQNPPTSKMSEVTNINVIQAPPGGDVLQLPPELQGQRVFVISDPAQLQLLQQLAQSQQMQQQHSTAADTSATTSLGDIVGSSSSIKDENPISPPSPGLVIGPVSESAII